MSDTDDAAPEQNPSASPHEDPGEIEEVDAVAVPEDEERERLPALQAALSRPLALRATPGVQAAAVAAGGFVAGAAVIGLARRRGGGAVGHRGLRRRDRRRDESLPIVASRSVLVDLHLLGSSGRGR